MRISCFYVTEEQRVGGVHWSPETTNQRAGGKGDHADTTHHRPGNLHTSSNFIPFSSIWTSLSSSSFCFYFFSSLWRSSSGPNSSWWGRTSIDPILNAVCPPVQSNAFSVSSPDFLFLWSPESWLANRAQLLWPEELGSVFSFSKGLEMNLFYSYHASWLASWLQSSVAVVTVGDSCGAPKVLNQQLTGQQMEAVRNVLVWLVSVKWTSETRWKIELYLCGTPLIEMCDAAAAADMLRHSEALWINVVLNFIQSYLS